MEWYAWSTPHWIKAILLARALLHFPLGRLAIRPKDRPSSQVARERVREKRQACCRHMRIRASVSWFGWECDLTKKKTRLWGHKLLFPPLPPIRNPANRCKWMSTRMGDARLGRSKIPDYLGSTSATILRRTSWGIYIKECEEIWSRWHWRSS